MRIDEIPTPALVVDVDVMQRNIEKMAASFAGGRCKLRPHFKAHKTPEIARRQLDAGSCSGITCATVGEAEVCAAHGLDDILIANQLIGPAKAERAAAVAGRCTLTAAVDSETGIEKLSAAASVAGTEIGALIDINVGMPRCGVGSEGAPALARKVAESPGLRLRGLMGYEGHAVLMRNPEKREAAARAAMAVLLDAREALESEGFPVEIVSGGGTGTYDITGQIDGITEIQAGSYVLMDDAYLALSLGFERALTLLGTVLSRPSPVLAVADCGHKSVTTDHGDPGLIHPEGASVMFLSDEHASIVVDAESQLGPGDMVRLSVGHIDPTINLHDRLWAVSGDEVAGAWAVEARGYVEQRQAP